jgi:hypothetical protein
LLKRLAEAVLEVPSREPSHNTDFDGFYDVPSATVLGVQQTELIPETHILNRGDLDRPSAPVPPHLPSALANASPMRPGPYGPRYRRELALWLTRPDHPLTARVMVNRIWQGHFGRGIVGTPNDMGRQGDPPSHPELLDWLATTFMSEGWSPKRIQRLMVTSATYRQSSRGTPALVERDPDNRLLARGPRFRVEAETVRDITLAVSGLLSARIGGRSVFPDQPDGVWDNPYSKDKWTLSEGEDRYRRSLYTFIRRTAPHPMLTTFDAPSRELCTVRRVRTNTPLQALTLLNDPAAFAAAQSLAGRVLREAAPEPEARAAHAFRLATARRPSASELAPLVRFYRDEVARYAADETAARTVAGPAAEASAPVLTAERAAWTMVASVILNLDETVTKE